MIAKPLGRKIPSTFDHVDKYPLRTLKRETVDTVERRISLYPGSYSRYDQGSEGACVGFSISRAKSLLDRTYFDAHWLYKEAQRVDEWDGEDYDGTSVRAGMDILRNVGHRQLVRGVPQEPDAKWGIAANRWATNVDEIRTSIASGVPVVLGVNWYDNFDNPHLSSGQAFGPGDKMSLEWWIGKNDLGSIRGGHAICVRGASDRRQAVQLINTWGTDYPLVWLPYETLQRLLDEYGEATLMTDR